MAINLVKLYPGTTEREVSFFYSANDYAIYLFLLLPRLHHNNIPIRNIFYCEDCLLLYIATPNDDWDSICEVQLPSDIGRGDQWPEITWN